MVHETTSLWIFNIKNWAMLGTCDCTQGSHQMFLFPSSKSVILKIWLAAEMCIFITTMLTFHKESLVFPLKLAVSANLPGCKLLYWWLDPAPLQSAESFHWLPWWSHLLILWDLCLSQRPLSSQSFACPYHSSPFSPCCDCSTRYAKAWHLFSVSLVCKVL